MLQVAEKRFHSIPKIKMAVCIETGLVPCSSLRLRINRARHVFIFSTECRTSALSDYVIGHTSNRRASRVTEGNDINTYKVRPSESMTRFFSQRASGLLRAIRVNPRSVMSR